MRIIFRALRGSVDLAVLWPTMIPAESHGNPGSSQLLSRPCLPHPPVPSHLDRYQIIRLHSFFFAAKTTSNWSPTKAPELISLSKVRCWGAAPMPSIVILSQYWQAGSQSWLTHSLIGTALYPCSLVRHHHHHHHLYFNTSRVISL